MKDGSTTVPASLPLWMWGNPNAEASETRNEGAAKMVLGELVGTSETQLPSRRWLIQALQNY